MGRMRKPLSWEVLDKRIADGRGSGHWDDYRCWLWISRKNASPKSNQVVASIPGYRRSSHFYSATEYFVALLIKWLWGDRVDVREQYPMWPMSHRHPLIDGPPNWRDTIVRGLVEIAEEAGIRHGTEPGSSGVPYVASLDLMLTLLEDDEQTIRGVSIKPHDLVTRSEPTDRLLERHELERRYMREIGGSFVIADGSILNHEMKANLEWMASYHCFLPEMDARSEDFFKAFMAVVDAPLKSALFLARQTASVDLQTARNWVFAGVWHQWLCVDLSSPIRMNRPLPINHELLGALRSQLAGEAS